MMTIAIYVCEENTKYRSKKVNDFFLKRKLKNNLSDFEIFRGDSICGMMHICVMDKDIQMTF